METKQRLFELALALPALVSALTLHEFAHAWAATRLGDDTPRRMGRLTLDPMAHFDPTGALFLLFAWYSGFGLGWAKPVPFNPRNLSHPRRDGMLIALAGPISNVLQSVAWLVALFVLRIATRGDGGLVDPQALSGWQSILGAVLLQGFVLNLMLAAFNIIPLPPLDGHYVLEALGPPFVTDFYNAIRPYAFLLLIVLISIPHLLDSILGPVGEFSYRTAYSALGYPL